MADKLWRVAAAIVGVAIVAMIMQNPAAVTAINAAKDIFVGSTRAALGR